MTSRAETGQEYMIRYTADASQAVDETNQLAQAVDDVGNEAQGSQGQTNMLTRSVGGLNTSMISGFLAAGLFGFTLGGLVDQMGAFAGQTGIGARAMLQLNDQMFRLSNLTGVPQFLESVANLLTEVADGVESIVRAGGGGGATQQQQSEAQRNILADILNFLAAPLPGGAQGAPPPIGNALRFLSGLVRPDSQQQQNALPTPPPLLPPSRPQSSRPPPPPSQQSQPTAGAGSITINVPVALNGDVYDERRLVREIQEGVIASLRNPAVQRRLQGGTI